MLAETIVASRAVVDLRTPGALSQVLGAVLPEDTASTITTGGPITARTGAPVYHAVAANVAAANVAAADVVAASAVMIVGVPAFSVRKRVNAVPSFPQPPVGPAAIGNVTVRKQNTYMTRVIANGGGSSGFASMEVAGLG